VCVEGPTVSSPQHMDGTRAACAVGDIDPVRCPSRNTEMKRAWRQSSTSVRYVVAEIQVAFCALTGSWRERVALGGVV